MITEPLAKKRGARERLTSLQLQLEEMGDEISIPFHSFTNYSMNIFYKSLTVVWIALLLYGVTMIVVSIPQEIESDNAYVATELVPAISFITIYQKLNNRLPSTREFYTWEIETYPEKANIDNVDDTMQTSYIQYSYNYQEQPTITGGTKEEVTSGYPRNYTLVVYAKHDWFGYYDSKTKTYSTSKSPWKNGIFGALFVCGIGYLSVRFWLMKYWRSDTL